VTTCVAPKPTTSASAGNIGGMYDNAGPEMLEEHEHERRQTRKAPHAKPLATTGATRLPRSVKPTRTATAGSRSRTTDEVIPAARTLVLSVRKRSDVRGRKEVGELGFRWLTSKNRDGSAR
jgi:hypothetical protein